MLLVGCSGPGAAEIIAESERIASMHTLAVAGLLLISLGVFAIGREPPRFPAILLALVVLHPTFTVSAIMGDCGDLKRCASWVFTGLAVLALGWQLARWSYGRNGGHPSRPQPQSEK